MLQILIHFPIQLLQTKNTLTIKKRGISSTISKTKTTGGSFIREAISSRELPQEIEEVIADSWRTSTISRYQDMTLCSNDGNVMHYRGMRIPILLI